MTDTLRNMRPLILTAALALILTGCTAAPTEPVAVDTTPTRDDKAWHNCVEVISNTTMDFTDNSITPLSICTNQRAEWDNFTDKWIIEVDRLVAHYQADLATVSIYRS